MKLSDKVKGIIATVAPTLGTALGGPLGGLAGNMLANIVGGGDAAAVEKAILSGDPASLLALKQAEQAFLERMRELDIDEEKLHASDRASARDREVKTGDYTTRVLAYITVVGFFAVLGAQFYIGIQGLHVPDGAQRTIDITTGVLFGMMFAVKDYYFGSSAGSKAKTDLLGKGHA